MQSGFGDLLPFFKVLGEHSCTQAEWSLIAQFNCTGDWAFYVEGDEVYHESELNKIGETMKIYLTDLNVEALIFDFYHFYGNSNSLLDSPGWYRSEARIIKNSVSLGREKY